MPSSSRNRSHPRRSSSARAAAPARASDSSRARNRRRAPERSACGPAAAAALTQARLGRGPGRVHARGAPRAGGRAPMVGVAEPRTGSTIAPSRGSPSHEPAAVQEPPGRQRGAGRVHGVDRGVGGEPLDARLRQDRPAPGQPPAAPGGEAARQPDVRRVGKDLERAAAGAALTQEQVVAGARGRRERLEPRRHPREQPCLVARRLVRPDAAARQLVLGDAAVQVAAGGRRDGQTGALGIVAQEAQTRARRRVDPDGLGPMRGRAAPSGPPLPRAPRSGPRATRPAGPRRAHARARRPPP